MYYPIENTQHNKACHVNYCPNIVTVTFCEKIFVWAKRNRQKQIAAARIHYDDEQNRKWNDQVEVLKGIMWI